MEVDYLVKEDRRVDSAWVETHPRFQRCGPGLTQVKLIWVKEHERHYQKGTETPPNDTSGGTDTVPK